MNTTSRRAIPILATFFTMLLLPSAALAASFEFYPATAEFSYKCPQEIQLIIDTGNSRSNAADVEIHFDPLKIQINDSLPTLSGIQVKPGDAYDSYVYNNVDNAAGVVKVAAASLNGGFSGRKNFISINFTPKSQATAVNFSIYFTGPGNTLDSNIADSVSNLDLLTRVSNALYTVTTKKCTPTEASGRLPATDQAQTEDVTPAAPKVAGILDTRNEVQPYLSTDSVSSFMLNLAKINSSIPGIGALALFSLILNIQSVFGISFFIWALRRWGRKLTKYTGIIVNKATGAEVPLAQLELYNQEGKKVASTHPDFHGRYYFDVAPGDYRLKIKAENFKEMESKLITAHDGKIYIHSLEYQDKRHALLEWRKHFNLYFIKDSLAFAVLAYLLAILALVINPAPLIVIIFSVDIAILVLATILKCLAANRLE